MLTFKYETAQAQEGDLYLPGTSRPAVICLLHGGFWRMPFGRAETADIEKDLVTRRYAVWNIEYRRLGSQGGGSSGTLSDVACAVNHLATLAGEGIDLDLDRVTVVGRSAGGQLALWVSSSSRRARGYPSRVAIVAVAGLAPITDLARADRKSVGDGAVGAFLGGGPDLVPDRYAEASPIQLLPLGVKQLIVHGACDEAAPRDQFRLYASAAQAAGDKVDLEEVPAAGHMDHLDSHGKGHDSLCQWLEQI